jgi:hypothetical protein
MISLTNKQYIYTPTHVIIKLLKTSDKEKNLSNQRKKYIYIQRNKNNSRLHLKLYKSKDNRMTFFH